MKKLAFLLLLFINLALYSQDEKSLKKDSNDVVFACPIEIMAQYPEGNAALMKFISDNLIWPEILNGSCIEGRVIVKFVVTETGELTDIKVVRSLEKHLDEEAVRVIKLMPKWIPAEINGRKISSYYTVPVLFKITR